MADNISALDAALATIILAAKEIAGVKYPRSILTAPDGSDLTPLTDAQLRATAVPVSGPLTDAALRATAVPVSGPVTDAQMRATALPVSGPLTDGQLRASAVPISAAALPLPSGAATQATLATLLSAGKPTTTYTLRLRGTLAAAAGQVEATVALFVTDNIITT